jgi:hypothetical protein
MSYLRCLMLTILSVGFLIAASPVTIQAQLPTGIIEGVVYDQMNAVILDASVRVTNSETGLARMIQTDNAGRFRALFLPPGKYNVEVEKQGFATTVRKEIALTLGQTLTLSFTLQVADVKQSLVVSSINTTDSLDPEQSTRLTGHSANNLPSNRRDFADFITLSPNVSLLESRYGSTLTINGQKGIHSSLSIDGSDANNPFYGERRGGQLPEFTIPLEGVKEYQVVTEGASAQYGRSTGAFVNVVTESGTNQFHGSTFLFFRDPAFASDNKEALRAHEQSDNPRKYQFGGSFGGPLKRDKLFFFLAYDQSKSDISRTNRLDPRLVSIFATRFNDPGEEGVIKRTSGAIAALARVDWMVNSKNTLTLRHNFSTANLRNSDFDVPTWGRSSNGREHDRTNAFIGQLITEFSPRLFNEVRWQYSREDRERLYEGPNFADVTIGGNDPVTGEATSFRFGRPFFLPGAGLDRRHNLTESLSLNRGAHLIKAGLELNYSRIINPFLGDGRYIFSSVEAFQAYLNNPNDLNGLLVYFQFIPLGGRTRAEAGTQSFWQVEPEVYIQDRWIPRENLSITYGLRYAAQSVEQPVTPLKMRRYAQFIGQPGFPSDGSIPSEKNGWQPRLGIAWKPAIDAKTLVRANMGIYYARTTGLSLFAPRTSDGTISGTIFSCCGFAPTPPANLGFLRFSRSFAPDNPGVSVYASDYHNPRSLQWSMGLEHELPGNLFFSLGFDYINTVHVARIVNRNAPTFIGHFAADGRKLFDGPRPFSKPDGSGIGDLSTTESSARSLYRGFKFALEKRFSESAGFQVNYTLSWTKSDDDTEQDPFLIQYADVTDFRPEYGYSNRDQRHRFNAYGFVNIPFGITFATTFQARSAQPFTLLLPFDANGDGNAFDRPFVNGRDLGRNSVRQHNQFYSVDIRLARTFTLERASLTGTLDVFNLTNNVNLRGAPQSLLFSFDGFLRSIYGTPRQAQLGLRLRF